MVRRGLRALLCRSSDEAGASGPSGKQGEDTRQISDGSHRAAGVTVMPIGAKRIAAVDVVAEVRQRSESEIGQICERQTLISFFYPIQNAEFSGPGRGAMEMVRRLRRVQMMDALSSKAISPAIAQ